jgi:hypothetical protein
MSDKLFDPRHVLSLSARAKKVEETQDSSTVESLLPVRLDAAEFREFKGHFHPRRRTAQRSTPFPNMYVDLATYMLELSVFIDSIYDGLCLMARNGASWKATKTDIGAEVTRAIAFRYDMGEDLMPKVESYIRAMATGGQHIVRDSEVFKGGKDVLFTGFRGATMSSLAHADLITEELPLTQTSAEGSEKALVEFLNSPLGQALAKTGAMIQKLVFGHDVSKSTSYKRLTAQHRLNWKIIPQLEDLLARGPLQKHGIVITLPQLRRQLSDASQQHLSKYNSILAVLEPNATLVNFKVQSKGADDELNAYLPRLQLHPEIRFSFVLNIPATFCEFITQTKDKQIPVAPLSIWASTWAGCMLRIPGTKSTGGMPLPSKAPPYVLMPSKLKEITDSRKKKGLYADPGRCNDDGLFITENGDLNYLPKSDDLNLVNTKEYEALLEETLKISFDAGTPISSHTGSVNPIYDLANPEYARKIKECKDKLSFYTGSAQAYDWNTNCVVTVSASSPDRVVSSKLVGAAVPNELNFASYMRLPFKEAMVSMFSRSTFSAKNVAVEADFFSMPGDWLETSLFTNFAKAYGYFESIGKVPKLGELIAKTAKDLGIKDLTDERVAPFELNRLDHNKTIYETGGKVVLKPDLSIGEALSSGSFILVCLVAAARDGRGGSRTNLSVFAAKNGLEAEEDPHFFDPALGGFDEFSNLYNYFGGRLFFEAASAMAAIPPKDLQAVDLNAPTNNIRFNLLCSEVIPMCKMFSKYVLEEVREKIYATADKQIEANKNPAVSEEELNIAGSREGMVLFPHQAEALTILKNHPRIAILDIGAGGGKTTIGIADIAMSFADGLIKRPFIFCPGNLVANWIDDLHKHTEGRWNVIPITSDTYKLWGDARLTEMIQKAPPNTIVVVGNSFISNRGRLPFIIGNNVEMLSDSVEFCKKLQPDYILIDESHRLRNTKSAIHRGIKAINQMPSVKYGRIGTGTLVQNVLSDVVGQSAIYNGQIFRTVNDFDAANKVEILAPDGRRVMDYDKEAPVKARARLREFATVLSYKRKEWAFMLPTPVETFIYVKFESVDDPEMGRMHQEFYETCLKNTVMELQGNLKIKKLLSAVDTAEETGGGGDDDGEGDEDEEDDRPKKKSKAKNATVRTASGSAIDVSSSIDDDSDDLSALEGALEPYIQRLERLLTDPFGDTKEEIDKVARTVFGARYGEPFVTAKVQRIVDRIKYHFTKQPWKKGEVYKASQMVDYGDASYILHPDKRAGSTEYKSIKPPSEDTENWKRQIRGKVMIFCRYIRTVDIIFNALPAELRKQAVRYHGALKEDKIANLDSFKSNPKVQILVANEEGLSEGHNLQMATRFIRAESPWAPGELDQSAARIFRPEVGGKNERPTIFLDWIITDGTLEVAKMGRLISKMLRKAQFDEGSNTKYYQNLNPLDLPIIKMTLENMRSLNRMSDLCSIGGHGDDGEPHPHSYIGQYAYLVGETAEEFREMRQTKRATMVAVNPTAMPKESKIIDFTPWVGNQTVPDRDDEGLQPLVRVLQDDKSPVTLALKEDSTSLNGQFVRTEMGLGKIVKVSTKRQRVVDEEEEGATEQPFGINTVWVELSQGGTWEGPPSKVMLATKVTEKSKNRLNSKAPKVTEADKKRAERINKEREDANKRSAARDKRIADKALQDITPKPPKQKPAAGTQAPQSATKLELFPVVYNQFLAVEAFTPNGEDVSRDLKKFGFMTFGEYFWIPVANAKNFGLILDWIEAKFDLSSKTVKLLDSLHDTFQSGRGRKFGVELSQPSLLPLFYKMRHRMSKMNGRKPELSLYPVILNGSLMLVADVATNPGLRKYSGKAIPGTSLKFEEADGLNIQFFDTKTAIANVYRQLRAAGYDLVNLSEFKQELKDLSTVQTKQ